MTHDHEQQAMLPPHSREAEESVLGSLLIDYEAIYDVIDIVKPSDFYVYGNGLIYDAMLKITRRNAIIDSMLIKEQLEADGKLQDAGGFVFIMGLMSVAVTSMNVGYYAKIVAEHSKRRQMINAGQRIASLAYDTEQELTTVLQSAQAEAATALDDSSQAKNSRMAGDIVTDIIKQAEAARMGEFSATLSMPWNTARHVRAVKGAMVVVGARPAMGKTSFLLQWMRHTAESGQFSLFFSLEMTAQECMARMIMQATGIDEKRVMGMSGFQPLTDAELGQVYAEHAKIQALPLIIDDTPSVHVDNFQNRCRAESLRRGGEDIAVFVDYLQYMDGGRRGASNYEAVSDVSKKLKATAKEVGWVVVAVQLSRGLESRTDKRPMLSDFRDSGQIEQDANLAFSLYRDEVYFPETTERPNVAEVLVLKNRAGRTGSFDLYWKGDAVSFRDLSRETVHL